ncbi:hypothetical protein GGR51DRAFT_558555 [Nemania sp. FL0031]|nr:hypothetical protein GGR51DRAFT_558555 [Nemania sp. FL0031]
MQPCSNSPAFRDPNITAKHNRLDDATGSMDNFRQDLTAFFAQEMRTMKEELQTSLRTSLQDDITTAVQGAIKPLENDIMAVKDEMIALKDSYKVLEDEIRAVNLTVGQNHHAYHDDIKAAKDDLTEKINALGQRLNASIAARESNSIARARNRTHPLKLTPLHSLSTNLPIEGFPETEKRLAMRNDLVVAQILRELDDPYRTLDYSDVLNPKERLKMLTGVNFKVNN